MKDIWPSAVKSYKICETPAGEMRTRGGQLALRSGLYALDLLLFAGGLGLMYGGLFLSADLEYVNLGRLLPQPFPQPLLYYLVIAVTGGGVAAAGLALLGCSWVHTSSRALASLYLFGLASWLVVELVSLLFASLAPDRLGLVLDPADLADSWQRSYGLPGREQLTAAIDYVQTIEECCGSVDGGKEYETSWWKIREYGPEGSVVPHSCCLRAGAVLGDIAPDGSGPAPHLDPLPANLTACQSQDPAVYGIARHTRGCFEPLTMWLKKKMRQGAYLTLAAILYQLCLMLAGICGAFHLFS